MAEIKLTNNGISAVINYHGAELRSLTKDGKEYMWQADPTYWNRTSPVLFPFVGQVAGGVYRVCGNEYKMGQHGFSRDMEFELLEKSDIISLHCPLTDENKHLIDKTSIDKMKKGAIIINTSRGGLINTADLLDGLKSRKVGAACIDVYEEEANLFFNDKSGHILDDDIMARLLSMPNVIVTSHQAFLTEEALSNIAETTIENITSYFESGDLKNEVCYQCENFTECSKNGKRRCK